MRKKLVKETPLIVDAYNRGMTLRELADFHQASANTIRAILVQAKVAIRRRGPKKGPRVKQNLNQSLVEETSPVTKEVTNGIQQPSL